MSPAERHRPLAHEIAFGCFLVLCVVRYASALGPFAGPTLVYAASLAGCLGMIALTARWPSDRAWRVRLAWYVVLMSGLFQYMKGTMPIIAGPHVDASLLAWDIRLFGSTPSLWFSGLERPWLTELMSGCYGLFFIYLYGSILHRLFGPLWIAKDFYVGLFIVYGIGYIGYSYIPALGPYQAASGAFLGEVAPVGPVSRLVREIVDRGTNGVDIFPSLHVAVTLYILTYDMIRSRRLFLVALVPATILCLATLYLRFHYGVDVVAGIALVAFAHGVRALRLSRLEPSGSSDLSRTAIQHA